MTQRDRKNTIIDLLSQVESLPFGEIPNDELIQGFISVWDNGGWPAQLSYIKAVLEACISANKPILECGSGVTSLLASVVLKRADIEVHSLEHEKDWADEVNFYKQQANITNLYVHYCPLRSYDDYDWYTIPKNLPDSFSVVICDGPPGATKGGRFGLLPCLINRLSKAVVLLDDFDRPGEQAIIKKWREAWGLDIKAQKSITQAFGMGIVSAPENVHSQTQ